MKHKKLPIGQTRKVQGVGDVVLHSVARHGWPIFKFLKDPPYFGTLCCAGEKGSAILEAFGLPVPAQGCLK